MKAWQTARIAEFLEHTTLAGTRDAQEYLEFYEWNIFSALDNYFIDNEER